MICVHVKLVCLSAGLLKASSCSTKLTQKYNNSNIQVVLKLVFLSQVDGED